MTTAGGRGFAAPEASGRVPLPVDVRLVPAAALCLAACLNVPVLPFSVATLLPGLLGTGALTVTVLFIATRGRWNRAATVLPLAAVALWAGTVAAGQAVTERVPLHAAGWEQAVGSGEPVRMSGTAAGPPVHSPGRFADRWFVPADISAFGHPVQGLSSPVTVHAAGDESWEGVAAGQTLCFTAVLEDAEGTVFARVRTAPDTGACGPAGDVAEGSDTGRDRVRSGLREAASGTVGTGPELLPGLILGDRSAQSPELDAAMKASGLSHLSAVSGANCTLIVGAVTMGLRSLRVHRSAVLVAVLGTLAVFVIVVGLEPSVVRAAVMGGLGAAALFFGRGRQALPLLCLAVCVLLYWEPSLAREAAFQLSVCATAGIILAARPLDQWLTALLSRWVPGPVAGAFSAALAVTVSAQVACQPVLLGISGHLSVWSVVANLLAAPLVPFVTVPGTLAAALVVPSPESAAVLLWLVAWPAAGIGWIATAVSGWPGALQPWPDGPIGAVLTVLHLTASLALMWLLLRWERGRPARVRRLGAPGPSGRSRRPRWPLRAAWMVVSAAVGSQAAVVLPPPGGSVPEDWSLAACDVGQGDMLVIRTGERSAAVVDTGPEPAGARRCLDTLAVESVDLLVLSHLHQDHVGGTAAVVECCAPVRILYSTADGDRDTGGEQTASAAAPDSAHRAEEGLAGSAGRTPASGGWGVDWTVLAAGAGAGQENDASVQLLVRAHTPEGSYRVMFTGDMEEDATRALIRRGMFPDSVDVLKVSHHGARNGGTDAAAATRPALSVVSVGADNSYGHPHAHIVGDLSRYGPVLRTDQHGTSVLSLRDGALVPTVTGARGRANG